MRSAALSNLSSLPTPVAAPPRRAASADAALSGPVADARGLEVGAALRRRRNDLGLTLAEVGQRSGFTTGYLSQLERDLATPSLTALAAIGRALGVELDFFLRTPNGRGHHFPASGRDFFSLSRHGMQYARVSGEFPGHVANALFVRIPAQYFSHPIKHEGEELVYVIEGRLRYTLGERSLDLAPGDVVHLPSSTAHCWENPTDEAACVLWVGTAPIFTHGPDASATDQALDAHGSPVGGAIRKKSVTPRRGKK